MGGDVWVLVEHERGETQAVTYEMLDEGQRIARRLDGKVVAVVLGHALRDWAPALASYGADLVYLVVHELLAQYTTDAYVSALVSLIRTREPFLLLMAATANGRDLAPRLAARLGVGLASDCTMVRLDAKGAVEAIRPTHHDRAYTTVTLAAGPPFLASIRPGAIGVGTPDCSREATVEAVVVGIDPADLRVRALKTTKADPASLDIAEAEIVVSGGRGVGSSKNWSVVQELAEALGASVAGSRMAMDAGWIPRERLVGQTGKSIAAKVYIALGISGAKEHLAGTREVKALVAINSDPTAPILRVADKAVVGDINEVVPALLERLRRMKGDGEAPVDGELGRELR